MSPKVAAKYLSWKAGWHANIGETSAILAIDEKLVDMSKAPVEWPAVEEDTSLLNISAPLTGSFYQMTKSGIWGDARKSTKELGEEFLEDIADGLVRTLAKYEKNYGSKPPRKS
jgi:creatinine amidohydrolase